MAAKKKARKKTTAKKKATTRKKTGTRKKAKKKAAPKKAAVPVETAPAERPTESGLLARLHEMERTLDAFRRRDWLHPFATDWPSWPKWPDLARDLQFPSVDVVSRDKDVVVKAEVPGFEKGDLSLTVTDRTLTIKGESRHEEEKEEGDLHRREIRTGSFSRTLTLPEDVDGARARASYKDGLLEVTLPKRRRSKRHAVRVSEKTTRR